MFDVSIFPLIITFAYLLAQRWIKFFVASFTWWRRCKVCIPNTKINHFFHSQVAALSPKCFFYFGIVK